MNTKLTSLEHRAAAAEQLVDSARERWRLQHALLEELRIEKTELAKSLDLIKQREIELRRDRTELQPVSYTHLTLPTIYSV